MVPYNCSLHFSSESDNLEIVRSVFIQPVRNLVVDGEVIFIRQFTEQRIMRIF